MIFSGPPEAGQVDYLRPVTRMGLLPFACHKQNHEDPIRERVCSPIHVSF